VCGEGVCGRGVAGLVREGGVSGGVDGEGDVNEVFEI